MKIISGLYCAAAAVALSFAATPYADAESLADAMVSAYRHSALIEQNRAVLRAADENVAGAVAQLRPVLQWVATHNIQRTEGNDGSTRNSSVGLRADVPLYDWGRSQLAIDSAKEQVLATRQALVGVEQNVLNSATEAFFGVRQATEQIALEQNSVRVIGQERQAAADRFEVGEITVTDVSLADARRAASQASLAAAQGQLEVARENYLAITGKKPGNLAPPPPLPKLPASLDEARLIGQKNHPAVLQAQRSVAAAELGVAAAAAERNPELSANVSAGVNRSPDQRGQYDNRLNGTVGITLNQTIYSGGRLPAEHRRAMAQRDQVRAQLLDTSRKVSQRVGTVWANISVARAQIGAIEQQISAAQQAYDGLREEARLGARTTLDVLNAEQSLLDAKADRITAEVNLQLAHYQLLAAMGLLTVENLKLGIPTYDPSQYYNAVRDAPYTSKQGKSLDRVLRAIGHNN